MTTLYAVSTGSYSDYSVRAIFSTREKAEEVARLFAEANDIEEYELDPDLGITTPKGKTAWRLWMSREGNVRGPYRSDAERFKPSSLKDEPALTAGEELPWQCWAKDEKHAIKIANEARLQIIASGKWPTPSPRWAWLPK